MGQNGRVRGDGRGLTALKNVQFVHYELDVDEALACKNLPTQLETITDEFDKLFDSGYKLTSRWDGQNNCMVAWLFGPESGDINTGLVLGGRGSTFAKCLKQILFKHHNCMGGDWRAYAGRAGSVVVDD